MKRFKPVFILLFLFSLVLTTTTASAGDLLMVEKQPENKFANSRLLSTDGSRYSFSTFMVGDGQATVRVYWSNENIEDRLVYEATISSQGKKRANTDIKKGVGTYRIKINGDVGTYVYAELSK